MVAWKDVFAEAIKIAKKLRNDDPKLSVPDSMKKAWKDPKVLALRAKFDAEKAKKEAKPAAKKPAKKKAKVKGAGKKLSGKPAKREHGKR